MNMNDLAIMISKKEGKKKEVGIGQIKEILGLVCDCVYNCPEDVLPLLLKAGKRRAQNRKRKK